jgi:phosphoserine phosphatase
MEVVDDYYTGELQGLVPEGSQKLIQLKDWADGEFGEGGWRLVAAFGDHHSDEPLLSAADKATAICPDRQLEKTAKQLDWEIRDWSG